MLRSSADKESGQQAAFLLLGATIFVALFLVRVAPLPQC